VTRSILAALFASCLALLSLPGDALTVSGEVGGDEARVIVKLRAQSKLLAAQGSTPVDTASARAAALGARIGVTLRAGLAIADDTQVVFGSGLTSRDLAQRLSQQSDVEYAVPDGRVFKRAAPSDPLYQAGGATGPASGQWYLRPNAGEVKSSIDVEPAWAVTIGNPAIVVAVLDTGVRFDHPDNRSVATGGNLLPGYDMISDPLSANDGDGRDADASDPGDWVTQAEVTNPNSVFYQCADGAQSSSWHGTQTSGLVAALTDNAVGMASVGRTVRVLPVRVLGKCGMGSDSDVLAGMLWAAGMSVPGVPANPNPARVISMSLGNSDETCNAAYVGIVNQITAAGVLIVAAAGNDGIGAESPANCPGVVSVGALRHVGTKVGFSNLGASVTISAPGGNCVNTAAGTPCLYPILSTTNTGATVPVASSYTDSYNPSIGTSFSTPLVAGTAALMLSAQPSLTPAQLTQFMQATARPFPTVGGSDATVVACTAPQLDATGTPIAQNECYCTTSTCGAGMLDAGTAVQAAAAGLPTGDFEVQGLWWNAPAASESGWGLNLAHQGTVIFATWFTYNQNGKAWWLSMTATKTGPNTYAGQLVETHGPPFSATPFVPGQVTSNVVGNAVLTFSDGNNGTFSYTVNGISQQKTITRQVYGVMPTCVFALHPPLYTATNLQDLWWAAPAGVEAGWGLNLTMQSNVIFATWFTYDEGGDPLWVSATVNASGANAYSGPLIRTTGPAFNAVPFSPANVQTTNVGTMTLTASDGNNATFAYTLNGVSQVKSITRQVFRTPGTMCM
jgi:serine protease